MSQKPLVSVIMPAFNAKEYIGRSIESALAQDFSNLELIVIDDSSTDDTASVVEEYAKKDERVVFIRNKVNMGVADSRNKGISIARGEYLAFLDSDDTWELNKLNQQMEIAVTSPCDVLIYSSYDFIDERDNSILKPYIVPKGTDYCKMLAENVIGCSSVLVSKAAVEAVGGFPTDIYHEDYALWMLILRDDSICPIGIENILMHHRQLFTARSYCKKKAALNRWRVYRRVLKLSMFKSLLAFCKYAINGMKKYI